VADKVGSLRPGTEANVVVWDGDPFEFATRATQVYIRGQLQTGPSRQDLLVQRYLNLPPKY
jgi:imidazolonepropionase-like amidohydrolase